jgi:hypothetical protein
MLNPRQILVFVPRQHVRFGSLADICSAKGHVRFASNSDRKSGRLCAGDATGGVGAIGAPTGPLLAIVGPRTPHTPRFAIWA